MKKKPAPAVVEPASVAEEAEPEDEEEPDHLSSTKRPLIIRKQPIV